MQDKWRQLIDEFGTDGVLIVSNTSGAAGEEQEVSPSNPDDNNPRQNYSKKHSVSPSYGIPQK